MNLNLSKPDGLTEAGNLACDIITAFLTSKNLVSNGSPMEGSGITSIYISPEEWAELGFEDDAWQGILVVEHSNGPHCEAFDWDKRNYTLMEELRAELNKIGCYAEQIDSSFSAIFHRPTSEQLVKET